MESFDQMPQKPAVKNEVSDSSLTTVEHSDSESLRRSSAISCESSDSSKRSLDSEQDSHSNEIAGSPLPPRKRAKTQEEKEQRRMERIMRNRQAAHASREKKRKHLEALERRCSELESERSRLTGLLSNFDQMCSRVQQLESAIRAAQSSGDISSLDSAMAMSAPLPSTAATSAPMCTFPLNGTVDGVAVSDPVLSVVKTESVDNSLNSTSSASSFMSDGVFTEGGNNNYLAVSGSPAPSLEEDCASPESLLKIKTEEELFYPYSPETAQSSDCVYEDPFGMMSFSFEPDYSTVDFNYHPESASKSRHPAVMTPLFDHYA